MNPKHLSAILLCAVLLTGCGSRGSAKTPDTTTVQATAAPVVVTTAPDPNEVDPNEMVDLENGITEKMYGRAILNEGNPARLAAAMKKAQNGEKVTVGVIGGSITQCQNFGVFFLCTTNGKSGTYEVYVDGERKGRLEADFTGGWGTYGNTRQIMLAKETAQHTIEIRPAEGSEDKGITILGLMVS